MMVHMDSGLKNSCPYQQLSKCLEEAIIPEWTIKEKTAQIQKNPQKGTIPTQLL